MTCLLDDLNQYLDIDTDRLLLIRRQHDRDLTQLISDNYFPRNEAIRECEPSEINTTEKRYELAVVVNSHSWHRQERAITLGLLKNLLCNSVLVCEPIDGITASFQQEMLSLGFVKRDAHIVASQELAQYHYNITQYNHKRRWNNSARWANPENFDKYRW